MPRILIADDELSLRKVLASALKREGYDVDTADDGAQAIEKLDASVEAEGEPFDLVITDLKMPNVDGMGVLAEVRARMKDLPVVLLTAHGTVDLAVGALKKGAFDFVTKPYDRDELLATVKKAVEQKRRDTHEPRTTDEARRLLVGASQRMIEIGDVIDRIADTPSTVLITGESGTGKELVALALHQKSQRRDKPFIRINCGAIPPTLIEAELFGHEKGAFTGAVTSKPGRFELADTGTLFLDEIGDLPVEMQVKLLRVLQESAFERVGGIKTIRVDVRLIAATNKDLQKAIAASEFREDLFYRLNVVPIALPPLRDRSEDVPPLVTHFIDKFNARLGRKIERLTPGAIETLQAYPWPGNIRELENIIERSILFADRSVIDVEDLPPEIVARVRGTRPTSLRPGDSTGHDGSMKDIVRQATAGLERELIQRALEETAGNVTHAARRLKISRKSLQIKMKELGLRERDDEVTGRTDRRSGET